MASGLSAVPFSDRLDDDGGGGAEAAAAVTSPETMTATGAVKAAAVSVVGTRVLVTPTSPWLLGSTLAGVRHPATPPLCQLCQLCQPYRHAWLPRNPPPPPSNYKCACCQNGLRY